MSESSGQPPAEEPRTSEEPRSSEEIRAEIEETRADLGDTVEALAAKTDVKAQAAQRVEAAKGTLRDSKDDLVGKVSQATPESAAAGAEQLSATVQQKPIPFVAMGAFAAGALMGWLLRRR